MRKMANVIVKSFSGGPDYQVDTDAKTCTCMAYRSGKTRPCKHIKLAMENLGASEPIAETPKIKPGKTHPTYSQAASAVVKMVRTRNIREAVYWLHYLAAHTERRFILIRRLAVISVEDNLNISTHEAVMGAVFGLLKAKQSPEADFRDYVREIIRICKSPNWWETPDGRDYVINGLARGIQCYWIIKNQPELSTAAGRMEAFDKALAEADYVKAIALTRMLKDDKAEQIEMSEHLRDFVKASGNTEAMRGLAVWMKMIGLLAGFDRNPVCHTIYRLFRGKLGNHDPVTVSEAEIDAAIAQCKSDWENPVPVPAWTQDGIHCAGADRRFAGTAEGMAYQCLSYLQYGRLDHSDPQIPSL
ncbi:MAG: hypothetical protein ACRESZ_17800, partial [Methylococcales bacterium]